MSYLCLFWFAFPILLAKSLETWPLRALSLSLSLSLSLELTPINAPQVCCCFNSISIQQWTQVSVSVCVAIVSALVDVLTQTVKLVSLATLCQL